jgi:hypothetical protein
MMLRLQDTQEPACAGEPWAKLDPQKIWMTKTLPVSQKSAEK